MRALTALYEFLPQLLIINNSLNYIRRAMEISVKEKLPIHDTLYIALTESKGGEKVTRDKKQFEIASKYVKAKYS
jgi:predicted nucleic acid-binding protein